ncbi:3-isopropylmalate dehydrogenase [Jeotgalibaca sp. PTS2502]|uniref:3-isopropylmalate dehydrogenase n=1 Tax=Jeotgalibaca sp. PTS2502 TaxID=1903686 RepID=UPI000973D5BE|nr:3-isopropylmalate dehydrogenase [Jeotgalibaca sp. PTS2502]APZ49956.1 3-isopropylmalate dehydrogenase [Jeotgalibaca sp. PTS2502]
MPKKIVVLEGDGIGPEIMSSAIAVLQAAVEKTDITFEFTAYPFGGAGIDQAGDPLPQETLVACQEADAILLGAIGGPKWDDAEKRPEQGLLQLRKALNLFANIRPIRVSDALLPFSPLKEKIVSGTDFVVVRELTGGIYFGEPRHLSAEEAYDTSRYQRYEIERIVRAAFDIAQSRQKKLVSVDKANVLAASKLWRKTVEDVASDYPDVAVSHLYVDAAAMLIVQKPTSFDVIVTENLFGDILSDEASVLPGTLGVLPSASHSESGVSLYEPIHGSAPDIAGKNIANPVSMILSAALMLRQSFGFHDIADQIEEACEAVMNAGTVTADLGGTTTTTEFTQAVIEQLKA